MRLRATKLSAIGFGDARLPLPSLDLQFATDKTLTARRGPTPAFSRASAATETGPDGLIRYAPENLALQSETLNNAIWVGAIQAPVITPDFATSPIGSNNADRLEWSVINGRLQQLVTLAINQPYTFSIWLKSNTGVNQNVELYLYFGSGGTNYGETKVVTPQWQRFEITASSSVVGSGQVIQIRSAQGSTDILAWGAQLERHTVARGYMPTTAAAVYGPRFDHDPVTLTCKGLLIEESRTNLCLRSEEFNNVTWAKSGTIVTAPVVTADQTDSPSGSLSADRIVFPAVAGVNAFSLVTQFFVQSAGAVHTASVYLRGLSGGEKVWWAWTPNGVTYVRKECVLTTSWQRFDFTYTSVAGNIFVQIGVDIRYLSQSTQPSQTIFAWGAQLETGSFPTSYIPTTTASVVRSADVCSITGADFTSFHNQSEGTLFAESLKITGPASNSFACGVSNGSFAEFTDLRYLSDTLLQSVTNHLNVTQFNASRGYTLGAVTRQSVAYALNDAAYCAQGGIVTVDVPPYNPPVVDRFQIGTAGSGITMLNGYVRSIRYYKKRLPNAKLQSLTL